MSHTIFSTASVLLLPAKSLTTESWLLRHTCLFLLLFLSSASLHFTVSCQPFWNLGFCSVVFYHTDDFFIECFKFIVRYLITFFICSLRTLPGDPSCLWANIHGADWHPLCNIIVSILLMVQINFLLLAVVRGRFSWTTSLHKVCIMGGGRKEDLHSLK